MIADDFPAVDAEFVASLRGMADNAAPHLAPPSAATVIPLARRRVARRRSVISGAFGVALLAGAGITQIVPAGLPLPGGPGSSAPLAYVSPAPAQGVPGVVGIAPAGNEPIGLEPAPGLERVGIAPMEETIAPLSAADDLALDDEYGAADGVEIAPVEIEAAAATSPTNLVVPGLLIAGTGALAASAAIAAQGHRRYSLTRATSVTR